MPILLFDIDLTLVDTDGAGREALNAAFRDLCGADDAFADVPFQGRTDTGIVGEALVRQGLTPAEASAMLPRLVARYLSHLRRVLTPDRGRVLPGVPALLDALAESPTAELGLATGNFREAAHLKLGCYGLDRHLSVGGFGDDHAEREAVVAVAARRVMAGRSELAAAGNKGGVVVIGDTPLDIEAAHANGFAAVGVATGFCTEAELRAAGAEVVLGDLSDTDGVREALLRAGDASDRVVS